MSTAWNWRETNMDLQVYYVLLKMQIIRLTFLIFDYIFVCGALSGATLLSYVVLQY